MPLDGKSTYDGRNFAPAEPLRRVKDAHRSGGYSSMLSFFREVCQEIEMQDELAWRQHLATGQVISTLRAGKLILKRDLTGDGYVFLKPAPSRNLQDRSNYPIFPSICEDLKAKWERAKPQVSAREFDDGYRTQIQLNTMDRVVRSHFKDIFDAPYELNEALSAQDFGTYITRFWYDEGLRPMFDLLPIIQNSSKVVHPGYGGCLNCDFEGVADDFRKTGTPMPQCPECEGYNLTKMIEPQIAESQDVVDAEVIQQGDIRGALLNFPACKFDLRVMAHQSSYFRYEQFIPLRVAQSLLGNLNFQTESAGVDNYGLNIMEALAARGGNTETTGGNEYYGFAPGAMSERVIYREYWLKPEWYAGFKLRTPEQTVSGTIPADVDFAELFQDGVMVGGYNSMNLMTAFHAEKPRLASGLYYVQSFSGLGKGLSDGVDIAKDLSEMHSMAMADIKRHAAAGVIVDKGLGLTQGDVRRMFKPEGVVFADIKKQGFSSVKQAVDKLQFEPVNPVLPNTMVQLANLLNLVSLSGDFSEGTLQQVDINTLGGQQLATSKEEGKKGAIIAMKAHHREISAEEICGLHRDHIKMPRYYPSEDGGGSRSAMKSKGMWVSGVEFPEEVKFDAAPDSAITQSTYERRLALREMIKDAGGVIPFAQLCQADPGMAGFYAEQFGAKIPTLDQGDLWNVCLSRLDNIVELANIYQDPAEILSALSKPLFQDEKWHLLKADFISQVLDDDEIATWPPQAKGAVQLLIKTHKDLQTAIQLEDEMRTQNAQNALAQRQQQLMAPMMAADAEAQGAQAAAGAAQELGGRVLDEESKEAEHGRQKERDEEQREHEINLEKLRQKGQQAAAQNKPTPNRKGK